MAILRTALLLGLLTGILLAIGWLFAGVGGMTIAFFLALIFNFATYWWSDKVVLSMYRASPSSDRKLNAAVEKVAKAAGVPKPAVYVIPTEVPNAFATGRSPRHAAVAVTQGLMHSLDSEELEGVIAHELAHIKNRDTLIGTLAATIAGAISWIAQIAWFSSIGNRNRGGAVLLPLVIFAPIAAALVQMAISRGREYMADRTGALFTKNPLSLASALEKIATLAAAHPLRGNVATAHLWIVNPFSGSTLLNLFNTHPPVKERIQRLKELAKELK
ncbi:MAG: zinc metalloprotease HtpX [Candidatus Aenigmatarchaeota archaeon]|nr:zinc metalloprotease HtpX [Candidatus Aenigmarchaeota archaeon]